MAKWPYNTQAWQKLPMVKLSTAPLCEGCAAMDIVKPANTVDHRIAINEGGDPFPALEGLASYCPACHSAKTARSGEAGAVRTRKPRKGCNPDGTPLDLVHPWHAGKGAARSLGGEPLRDLRGKSLGAAASVPTPEVNFELVSGPKGPRSTADFLDDALDDLWA